MKTWLILILSFVALVGCKCDPTLPQIPNEHLFTPDIANQLCVEYRLVDTTRILFAKVGQTRLTAGGPCDHMRGFSRGGWKNVQNWIRDAIQ